MSLLLDTNILIPFLEEESDRLPVRMLSAIHESHGEVMVSAASLWEIALKTRIGKLPLKKELHRIPGMIGEFGMLLLPIDHHHALVELRDNPATRDPFDRLLLAQCQVENMELVTLDRVLAVHPLAWRAP